MFSLFTFCGLRANRCMLSAQTTSMAMFRSYCKLQRAVVPELKILKDSYSAVKGQFGYVVGYVVSKI